MLKPVNVLPVLLLLCVTRGMAFEVWDFASGKSKAEVLREAQSRGDILDEKEDGAVFLHRRDLHTGVLGTYQLSFCDAGLASVSKVMSFVVQDYAKEQFLLVKQFGSPLVSVSEESLKNPMGAWIWQEIKHEWSSPQDKIQLVLNVPITSPIQMEPSLRLVHEDTSKCGQ